MSAMRHKVKPLAVFPSPVGRPELKTFRVFPAEAWESLGGKPGQYRIQLDDAFVVRQGEVRSFFTQDGLERVLWRWAMGALGLSESACVCPSVEKGTPVWARVGFPSGEDNENGDPVGSEVGWAKTRTRTHPFQDEYGDWRVWVYLRKEPVLLADLRPSADGESLMLLETKTRRGA